MFATPVPIVAMVAWHLAVQAELKREADDLRRRLGEPARYDGVGDDPGTATTTAPAQLPGWRPSGKDPS